MKRECLSQIILYLLVPLDGNQCRSQIHYVLAICTIFYDSWYPKYNEICRTIQLKPYYHQETKRISEDSTICNVFDQLTDIHSTDAFSFFPVLVDSREKT